jgi:hypothetical protein
MTPTDRSNREIESIQLEQSSKGVGVTSVRAGSRQVIDVVAIVIENAFRPANGESATNAVMNWMNSSITAEQVCQRCASFATLGGHFYGSLDWQASRTETRKLC